jgi:hypothetical protein
MNKTFSSLFIKVMPYIMSGSDWQRYALNLNLQLKVKLLEQSLNVRTFVVGPMYEAQARKFLETTLAVSYVVIAMIKNMITNVSKYGYPYLVSLIRYTGAYCYTLLNRFIGYLGTVDFVSTSSQMLWNTKYIVRDLYLSFNGISSRMNFGSFREVGYQKLEVLVPHDYFLKFLNLRPTFLQRVIDVIPALGGVSLSLANKYGISNIPSTWLKLFMSSYSNISFEFSKWLYFFKAIIRPGVVRAFSYEIILSLIIRVLLKSSGYIYWLTHGGKKRPSIKRGEFLFSSILSEFEQSMSYKYIRFSFFLAGLLGVNPQILSPLVILFLIRFLNNMREKTKMKIDAKLHASIDVNIQNRHQGATMKDFFSNDVSSIISYIRKVGTYGTLPMLSWPFSRLARLRPPGYIRFVFSMVLSPVLIPILFLVNTGFSISLNMSLLSEYGKLIFRNINKNVLRRAARIVDTVPIVFFDTLVPQDGLFKNTRYSYWFLWGWRRAVAPVHGFVAGPVLPPRNIGGDNDSSDSSDDPDEPHERQDDDEPRNPWIGEPIIDRVADIMQHQDPVVLQHLNPVGYNLLYRNVQSHRISDEEGIPEYSQTFESYHYDAPLVSHASKFFEPYGKRDLVQYNVPTATKDLIFQSLDKYTNRETAGVFDELSPIDGVEFRDWVYSILDSFLAHNLENLTFDISAFSVDDLTKKSRKSSPGLRYKKRGFSDKESTLPQSIDDALQLYSDIINGTARTHYWAAVIIPKKSKIGAPSVRVACMGDMDYYIVQYTLMKPLIKAISKSNFSSEFRLFHGYFHEEVMKIKGHNNYVESIDLKDFGGRIGPEVLGLITDWYSQKLSADGYMGYEYVFRAIMDDIVNAKIIPPWNLISEKTVIETTSGWKDGPYGTTSMGALSLLVGFLYIVWCRLQKQRPSLRLTLKYGSILTLIRHINLSIHGDNYLAGFPPELTPWFSFQDSESYLDKLGWTLKELSFGAIDGKELMGYIIKSVYVKGIQTYVGYRELPKILRSLFYRKRKHENAAHEREYLRQILVCLALNDFWNKEFFGYCMFLLTELGYPQFQITDMDLESLYQDAYNLIQSDGFGVEEISSFWTVERRRPIEGALPLDSF